MRPPDVTATPTACIGPSVIFNDVINSGKADGVFTVKVGQGVALCDPQGLIPTATIAASSSADVVTQNALPSASQTYAQNKAWYSGTGTSAKGVPLGIQKFWDPITAAQASGGAFCCDALYYGSDGLGRGTPTNDPPIVDVTKNADFKPVPLLGAALEKAVVPGGVCTDGKPTTAVKEGLSDAKNVEEEEYLEGQAFYACVAPSMYVLPKVNSVAVTQAANAAKQKKCAETLTNMLRMNRVTAGISTESTTCTDGGLVIAGKAAAASNNYCTGTGYSAVDYPLGGLFRHTLFPTGTATRMLALRTLPLLAQPRPSMGWQSSPLFRAVRTCLVTLPLRPTLVVVPTRLVRPRLLPGAVLRLRSSRAQRQPVTRLPARLRRSKRRPGCFPQPDFPPVVAIVWVFELLHMW